MRLCEGETLGSIWTLAAAWSLSHVVVVEACWQLAGHVAEKLHTQDFLRESPNEVRQNKSPKGSITDKGSSQL